MSDAPGGRAESAPPVHGRPGRRAVPSRPVIPYPTDHLLAVVDDTAAAARCLVALHAAGFAEDDTVLLSTAGGGAGLDALAARHPRWTRLLRLIQFTTMDQRPDLVLYEASLEAGRCVVAVHVRERTAMLTARSIVVAQGAHFVNHFGRTATEEFDRWRGPELDLPELMRR